MSSSFFIGIGGGTGAGKTTLVQRIAELYPLEVLRISLDNYYRDRSHLPPNERGVINFDHPDALDWKLLRNHMVKLLVGESVSMPSYDFQTHTRKISGVLTQPNKIIILEGILALYDKTVTHLMNLMIYVEADADVRILRRLKRDIKERGRSVDLVIQQYLQTVKPMHEKFVKSTKSKANLIIPSDFKQKCITQIISMIHIDFDCKSKKWRN